MNIRSAELGDARILAEFNVLMARETEGLELDPQRVLGGVTALLCAPEKGTYFVADVENAGVNCIAGQLLITYEWSDWRNGSFWWIQSVFVPEKFRGQGIF